MNLSAQLIEEQAMLHESALVSLFEAKGYQCEEIKNPHSTMYLFKADGIPHIDYTKEPNPNWQVIRSTSNPAVDWL